MAFVIVLETVLISMVSSTLSISKLTSTIIVPMTVWHGPPYGCGYGRVSNMFGIGRPMAAATLWACA